MFKDKANELWELANSVDVGEIKENCEISEEIFLTESRKGSSSAIIMGMIFQAGKMEGTREERKRRNSSI